MAILVFRPGTEDTYPTFDADNMQTNTGFEPITAKMWRGAPHRRKKSCSCHTVAQVATVCGATSARRQLPGIDPKSCVGKSSAAQKWLKRYKSLNLR